jgi:hypothetical protein
MTKRRGWIVGGSIVVALVAVFYVIGGTNQASETAGPASTSSSSPDGASRTSTPPSSTTATPTSSPTSAPAGSLDWSEDLLDAGGTPARDSAVRLVETFSPVCGGARVRGATYAGQLHPMVLVGPSEDPIGNQWESTVAQSPEFTTETGHSVPAALRPRTSTQVQLVACVTETQVPASSCGVYTRSSDGTSGELRRTKGRVTVRVRTVTTGVEIGRQTFDRSASRCPTTASGPVASGQPPWVLDGETPEVKDAFTFLNGFLTGSPR